MLPLVARLLVVILFVPQLVVRKRMCQLVFQVVELSVDQRYQLMPQPVVTFDQFVQLQGLFFVELLVNL